MFARIAGALMLLFGIGLALSALAAAVVGTFAFVWLAIKVAVMAGLLYLAWLLFRVPGLLLKILGALVLVLGVRLAFAAIGALVVGTLGAVLLAIKGIVALFLLFFGWRWLSTGEFTLLNRQGFNCF